MSVLGRLGANNCNLPTILAEYDAACADAAANLQVKGKLLATALKEQSSWPVYYDERRVELKTLVKYFEMQVAKVRSEQTKRYMESYTKALSERAVDKYIDHEQDYIAMYNLLLEVSEVYEKYVSIVDCFSKRGFALRDLTIIHEHAIQDALL